jgi:NAD(P)-dependent dehydrogenase (short-subunit alcohol dehydrogenase family)
MSGRHADESGHGPSVGRVVVITGAASGSGQALALGLAEAGYRVAAADVADLSATASALAARGPADAFLTVPTDVTAEAAVSHLMETAIARWGRIDALVNCAGIYPRASVREMAPEAWRQVLEVNLTGAFLCCRAALPAMMDQRYGRIVNFTSGLARRGARGGAAYAASKAGVEALTLSLAREVAEYGINVNAVAPGPTDTPLLRSAQSPEEIAALLRQKLRPVLSRPQDAVAPVRLLLGPEGDAITGQIWALRD